MESSTITPRYRYPGVKPFTTEEQGLFFGRDKDIDDLFSLIFVKQVVVLNSKSGYGKSSLINAGIIPKLQAETQFVYFPIRFNNYSEKEDPTEEAISPTDTVRLLLKAGSPSVTETELFSPLDTLIKDENSFWYWLKTRQWKSQQTQFILFFDQFEELFTYKKPQIDEFSEQLAQLLYPSIPLQFQQRMVELDKLNLLDDPLQDFLYQSPDVKVVISMRSDRLSLLNGITDRHPAILQNWYELKALSRTQAEEAIIKPALKEDISYSSPTFTYTSDAVEAILDNIADQQDGKIDSATLQILCRYIENELVGKQSDVEISPKKLGDIKDIFQKYYEGILNQFTEDNRSKVQRLIEDELIAVDSDSRNSLSEGFIHDRLKINPDLLTQLEASSLLRKERDANGRLLYEVSHDTLVGAIKRVAATRWAVEDETRKKKLEQDLADERTRTEELQKLTKRAQDNEKKAKARSQIAIGAAIVALLVAGLAVYFWLQAQNEQERAEQAEKTANQNAQSLSIALDQVNLQKVNELQAIGQRYEEYDEYALALQVYRKADSLVSNIQKPTAGLQINTPAEAISDSDLAVLKNRLVTRIDSCQQKLQKQP
ncbi:hypothetical protein GO755_22015 [Spirosoma sp. HMF4905]|uniref:Novel STAND NTPase 1 domain-containing protein n=1 Tax=Spirosoma arboris TaxID=2682092 RepID=A0A7K1SG63_9BACT|nr:hypothetical protein [Spirosoma arboris]MVM32733.1 hypothetical protein [Spirosoma arboris]